MLLRCGRRLSRLSSGRRGRPPRRERPREGPPVSFAVHKPYDCLSAFTGAAGQRTLADLGLGVPRDAYAVGRLDRDSEGLLVLSNDERFTHTALTTATKTYLVQVEGVLTDEAAAALLHTGVGTYAPVVAVEAVEAAVADNFPDSLEAQSVLTGRLPAAPYVRRRRATPTQWVRCEIAEGKNRQVRKMLAAVGLPVLRLFREKIGALSIFDVPGLASGGRAVPIDGPARVFPRRPTEDEVKDST